MSLDRIFPLVSLIWAASEGILFIFKRSKQSGVDKSLRYLWIVIAPATTLGVLLGLQGAGRINFMQNYLHVTGIVFICIGLIIRWISILTLWKYFSVDVAIREEQKIIRTGLYSMIRHPSYTGALLSFLGLSLALMSWLSLLVIFIPVTIAFLYRIKVEESILEEKFGHDYNHYKKHTNKLIPGIF